MKVITLDYETYYDKEYSLRKMTTQEYIKSPLFQVIGVSVKVGNGKAEWFSGSMADTKAWLNQFDWADALVIAHNMLFDGAILSWVFDIHPKMYFCTMQGSRPFLVPFIDGGRMSLAKVSEHLGLGFKGTEVVSALGKRREHFLVPELKRYSEYCINDTELCYKIAQHLIPHFPKAELHLLDLNIRKFTDPVLFLDRDVLSESLATIKARKEQALTDSGLTDRGLLMSNDKLAAVLKLMGVDPPTKVSIKTGKTAYAFAKTDQGLKDLLEHPDPAVQAVVAARLEVKSTIAETRTQRLINVAHSGGSFAVPLLYYGAHTGRLSGMDKLNMQNLTRGSEERRAIAAALGYKIVAGDLSNIEARILAVLAGQMDLVRAFAAGVDVYCQLATRLFNMEVTKDNFIERFLGKSAFLSCQYGTGAVKLCNTVNQNPNVDITFREAERIVYGYRNTYAKVPELWRVAKGWLEHMSTEQPTPLGYKCLKIHSKYVAKDLTHAAPAILLPNGMPIYYPDLYIDASKDYYYRNKRITKKIYGAAVIENVCQALARIVLSEAEQRMVTKHNRYSCLQVHDELLYVVADNDVAEFTVQLEEELTRTVPWLPELPVACEIASGQNYKDAK